MVRVKHAVGILANFIVGVMLLYMLASAVRVDLTKPWHTLQQIAKSPNDLTSIDSNGNGRIDAGIIEDTLQDITNNGATTSRTINVGGLNSAGSIISAGDLNVGAGKLFVDVSTGRVGINTLNPQATLDVNGDVFINGHLGIGTPSTPSEKLRIRGSGNFEVAVILENTDAIAAGGMRLEGNPDKLVIGTWGSVPIHFITQAVDAMVVDINQRVGIGTASPQAKLDVNGNVRVNGNIYANAFYYTSDKKLKNNITYLTQEEDILHKILELKPVKYEINGEYKYGLIAQDLEKIFPEMVKEDPQGYKHIDYAQLIPLMIESIKELEKENQELRNELNSLKGANK